MSTTPSKLGKTSPEVGLGGDYIFYAFFSITYSQMFTPCFGPDLISLWAFLGCYKLHSFVTIQFNCPPLSNNYTVEIRYEYFNAVQ